MMLPHHIAIDGPAACGKTTLGRRLSRALGCIFLDAGVLYRTITWQAQQQNIALDDEAALTDLAARLTVYATPEYIRVNKRPPRRDLATTGIDVAVPFVAQHPTVRDYVRRIQTRIAKSDAVVFAGRDIGTVVLPNAELKFYIEADLNERVARQLARSEQQLEREFLTTLIDWRDTLDRERRWSPLRPAADAIQLDTTHLSTDETFDLVWQHIERFSALG